MYFIKLHAIENQRDINTSNHPYDQSTHMTEQTTNCLTVISLVSYACCLFWINAFYLGLDEIKYIYIVKNSVKYTYVLSCNYFCLLVEYCIEIILYPFTPDILAAA